MWLWCLKNGKSLWLTGYIVNLESLLFDWLIDWLIIHQGGAQVLSITKKEKKNVERKKEKKKELKMEGKRWKNSC